MDTNTAAPAAPSSASAQPSAVTTPSSAAAQSSSAPAQNLIPADDTNIVYTGRIDFSDPKKPAFAYPGVQISARFEGTKIEALIGGGTQQNYFNVTVDNNEPVVIQGSRNTKPYLIAENLADGEHTIRIWKRTEGLCGTARFGGFILQEGKKLLPPPEKKKLIEFIGDSITCGYGNMISTHQPENYHFNPANENNELSWGALTAKALNADYAAVAYSGRGIFRNCDGTETGTLGVLYGAVYPDRPQQLNWDYSRYTPDVIVINLGTNDYNSLQTKQDMSTQEFDDAYSASYSALISRLRKLYGTQTVIICAVGPMMSDGFPAGQRVWTRIRQAVKNMTGALAAAGDENIHYLELTPQSSPFGEDWHPTAATHAAMAVQTAAAVKNAARW